MILTKTLSTIPLWLGDTKEGFKSIENSSSNTEGTRFQLGGADNDSDELFQDDYVGEGPLSPRLESSLSYISIASTSPQNIENTEENTPIPPWIKVNQSLKVKPTETQKDPEKVKKGNIGIQWGKNRQRPIPTRKENEPPQPKRTTSADDLESSDDY